jgi:hypothetical protein
MASLRPILVVARGQQHHYEKPLRTSNRPFVLCEDWLPERVDEIDPALLLSLTTDWWEADHLLRRAGERSIPTVLLMDGIVEWRHQWEDPRNGAREGVGLFLQTPADKIACLGRQSARLLERWGNAGRCEVIGTPRFDDYLADPIPPPEPGGPRHLLVMTANTPGFTPKQVALVERSLLDLQSALSGRPDWVPIWRVRGGLRDRVALRSVRPDLESAPLRQALAAAHAVVTTPSTAQLEAFLARRPTALLDYANCPHYVPAAWRITASAHLGPALDELADPSPAKVLYQEEVLRDCLECASPATPRLFSLIESMIEIADRLREEGRPLAFPARLVSLDDSAAPPPDLGALYPGNPSFASGDVAELQRRLALARQESRSWKRRAEIAMSLRGVTRRLLGRGGA